MLYLELAQEALVDFGLFYYCQGRGVPHDQAYTEMLDQIVLAEALGFGECWFAEHHFTDYSILPSPNLMIASALQRTRRMRFGNCVNALPFHHPLRLAAEAAMLDNLAQGRFDFGVGKGVRPGEFAKLGITYDYAQAAAMTEEAIDILCKVWTQDSASYTGRFWSFPELSLRPRVYQRPHPPLHEVASRHLSGPCWGTGLASGHAFHANGGRSTLYQRVSHGPGGARRARGRGATPPAGVALP